MGTMVCLAALGASVLAQELTLDQALKLAKERNGTIRAAMQDVKAAKGRTAQSFSAFLPTITPSAAYRSNRQEINAGSRTRFLQTEGWSTEIEARWRVLDFGERDFNYRSSRRSEEAVEAQSLNTLRRTLFSVHQNYLEALRAQELRRVAKVQEERTKLILEQTKARVEAKAAAAISILQAEADAENAKVNVINAENNVVVSEALLKAVIGWDEAEAFPSLQAFPAPQSYADPASVAGVIEDGLARRPDLVARRKNVESLRLQERLRQREAIGAVSLEAGFTQSLTPDSLENRTAGLFLSVPLFDGGLSRAAHRVARANLEAAREELVQAERDAGQEIRAVLRNYQLNVQRLEAAKVALNAARKNYEAAVESQKAGVYDIIQVSTAQVSLVTAESNFINAVYDYYLIEVQLRLVTGQPIPGEIETQP
jgi:outer membrane protein